MVQATAIPEPCLEKRELSSCVGCPACPGCSPAAPHWARMVQATRLSLVWEKREPSSCVPCPACPVWCVVVVCDNRPSLLSLACRRGWPGCTVMEGEDGAAAASLTRSLSWVAEDPTLLPSYEPEPLFGSHQPRQELIYDEEVSILSEFKVAQPEGEGARPVSPIELFYDLFIAATLSKLGPVLADNLSEHPIQIAFFVVIFLLVFESWLQVTYFLNRFASESASDHLFILVNILGLGGLNLNVRRCVEGGEGHDCLAASGWLAFTRAGVCVWLLLAGVQQHYEHPKAFSFSRYHLIMNLLVLSLLIVATLLPLPVPSAPALRMDVLLVLAVALLGSLLSPLVMWVSSADYRRAYVPMNAELAAERFSLIYIVSLGEIVLSGVVPDLREGDGWSMVLSSTAVMVLAVMTASLFMLCFFHLYDLAAKRAEKHPVEVGKGSLIHEMSMLRAWTLLRATSLLAMLCSLVAATYDRLAGGEHPGSFDSSLDRVILSVAIALKVALFSLTSRLYLRHVRVAYGIWADATAVVLEGAVMPAGLGLLLSDLGYTAVSVGVLAVLVVMRAVALPVKLTETGVKKVLTTLVGEGNEGEAVVLREEKKEGRRFMTTAMRQGNKG